MSSSSKTSHDAVNRYRRWLAFYPQTWRIAREDEIMAVLADSASTARGSDYYAEVVSLLRGGIKVRWEISVRQPTWRVVAQGLRFAGAVALLISGGLGALMLVAMATHPFAFKASPVLAVMAVMAVAGLALTTAYLMASRGNLRGALPLQCLGDTCGFCFFIARLDLGPGIAMPRLLPLAVAGVVALKATFFLVFLTRNGA